MILAPNGARAKLHPDSQAEPRMRGDAETKGRSEMEGWGRLRRPPLNGASRASLSRRRRLNTGHQARREAGAERTLYAVACMPLLGPHAAAHWAVKQNFPLVL